VGCGGGRGPIPMSPEQVAFSAKHYLKIKKNSLIIEK